jgi:hypothetical protein
MMRVQIDTAKMPNSLVPLDAEKCAIETHVALGNIRIGKTGLDKLSKPDSPGLSDRTGDRQ